MFHHRYGKNFIMQVEKYFSQYGCRKRNYNLRVKSGNVMKLFSYIFADYYLFKYSDTSNLIINEGFSG